MSARPPSVLVLACSATTTGEFTMAMELCRRLTHVGALHALVGTPLAAQAHWHGAQVHVYPTLLREPALKKMASVFQLVRPDVVLVADILLASGLSPEFGGALGSVLEALSQHTRVVALDLYDFDRTARDVDVFGRPLFPTHVPVVGPRVGRVHPVPSLAAQPNARGRGFYSMLPAGTPLSSLEKQTVRQALNVPADHALVLVSSSAWQHRLATHPEGARVATHFPALMGALMQGAAEQSRPWHVVHVGPTPWPHAATSSRLSWQQKSSIPPQEFQRMLGAADLYVSPNMPASTAVRAARLRVPVATLFASAKVENGAVHGTSAAAQALGTYAELTRGGHPFFLWPVGLHAMLAQVIKDNPFVHTQLLLDVLAPDDAVAGMARLVRDTSAADALRHQQEQYFSATDALLGSPQDAWAAALEAT